MSDEHPTYVRSTCERINDEPIILKGMTSTELRLAIYVSFGFWLPVSIILGVTIGKIQLLLGFVGVAGILSVLAVGSIFQKVKRNKPDGYYQQLVTIFLSKIGLKKMPFIKYSGAWSVGRNNM